MVANQSNGAPSPRSIRTWQDAEENARDWMRYMGYSDAEVTGGGPDGGLDVVAGAAVAQVKAQIGRAGRKEVQALYGAAFDQPGEKLLFVMGGYSGPAVDYADEAGIALFVYGYDGSVEPINGEASPLILRVTENQLSASGLAPPTTDHNTLERLAPPTTGYNALNRFGDALESAFMRSVNRVGGLGRAARLVLALLFFASFALLLVVEAVWVSVGLAIAFSLSGLGLVVWLLWVAVGKLMRLCGGR